MCIRDRLKPDGTVAFMSSRLGSIALNDYGQWETYRLSKAALNMGARSFFHHADFRGGKTARSPKRRRA